MGKGKSMTVKHIATGGVVVKTERGRTSVLLIKDSYGHWTWPKGHLEKGETPEAGALREIAEETGQTKTKIIKEIGLQEYCYTLKGKTVLKKVHVFLIKASAREKIKVQTSEIETAKWFRAEDAIEKIEYEGSRTLLKKGIKAFEARHGGNL